MATSSARLTIAALLGTVSTAANSVTTIFDVTTDGVGMVHSFVRDASEKQSIRSVVDMENFESALQEEKAQEMTSRQLAILEFRNQSEDHARLYEGNFNKIGALLEARRAKLVKAA